MKKSHTIYIAVVVVVLAIVSADAEQTTGRKVSSPEAERREKIVRPEERGASLDKRSPDEVVEVLKGSEDRIMRRKAAKAMGDRSLDAQNRFTDAEKKAVREITESYLKQAKAAKADDRVEACQQIERLWYAAAPALLENIDSKDPAIAELSIKSLILMRNEEIIAALVTKSKTATNQYSRDMAMFALKKMKEERKSLIPGRECMEKDKSAELYDRLVVPALAELKQGMEVVENEPASDKSQVMNNLEQLEKAKQAWAMLHSKGPNDEPKIEDLLQHIPGTLEWPNGCTYQINEVSKPAVAVWNGRTYHCSDR